MTTGRWIAIGMAGFAAINAVQAYQNANQFHGEPLRGTSPPRPGSPAITSENCLTVRQAENMAFRQTVIASGLALGALYLWMR
jgi:hypothetical protein